MMEERLGIYEMIVVTYAHLFYIFFHTHQPVLDIYFENNNLLAKMIESKCIDPELQTHHLNLYGLTHLSIDEVEYIAQIRPSRKDPYGIHFRSDPEEIQFYKNRY